MLMDLDCDGTSSPITNGQLLINVNKITWSAVFCSARSRAFLIACAITRLSRLADCRNYYCGHIICADACFIGLSRYTCRTAIYL